MNQTNTDTPTRTAIQAQPALVFVEAPPLYVVTPAGHPADVAGYAVARVLSDIGELTKVQFYKGYSATLQADSLTPIVQHTPAYRAVVAAFAY